MSVSRRAVHGSIGLGRRALLITLAVALLALIAGALWSFAWPSASARGEYALAPLDGFEPGSVTAFLRDGEQVRELALGEQYDERPPGYRTLGTGLFYVVRLPNEEVRVFSGAAPFRESTIVWYRQDNVGGLFEDWVGLFAEGRRGSRWAIDGTRVFGPAPRSLDEHPFHVRADGVLVVDLGTVVTGSTRNELPPPYDVLDPAWPTSGWPSAR